MGEVVCSGRFSIPVLYEDNHLLAVVKPANLPVQADASGGDDFLSIMKRYIGEKIPQAGGGVSGAGAPAGPAGGRGGGAGAWDKGTIFSFCHIEL